MVSHPHPSMTANTLRRRLPIQSQRETAVWQELDMRELSPEAPLAVSTGLINVLAALTPRRAPSPKRAAKRRKVSTPPPYHLLDLPVEPLDDPAD
jgi:hypothetical protein